MNQGSFIQLKMQAHLIFKVYQWEKCTQSLSSTLINFFIIISLRLSRAAQKFVAGRSLPTPGLSVQSKNSIRSFSLTIWCSAHRALSRCWIGFRTPSLLLSKQLIFFVFCSKSKLQSRFREKEGGDGFIIRPPPLQVWGSNVISINDQLRKDAQSGILKKSKHISQIKILLAIATFRQLKQEHFPSNGKLKQT